MAVGYVTVGSTVSGTGTTISVPFPATVTAGHYPLLLVESGNGATPAAPAGWNLIWSGNAGSASATDVGAVKGYIYELSGKLADGTEGGTSVTVNRTTGHTLGKIIIWSGADATTPITFSTTTKSDVASGNFNTNTVPSKANDINDMFHAFSFHDRDSSVAPSFGSPDFANITTSTPAGRAVTSTTSGGGGGLCTFDGDPNSNSTGDVSFTCTFTSTIWVGVLGRINASGSMGGTPGGKANVQLGGTWVAKPVKVSIGGVWVEKPLKVFKSGAWVLA